MPIHTDNEILDIILRRLNTDKGVGTPYERLNVDVQSEAGEFIMNVRYLLADLVSKGMVERYVQADKISVLYWILPAGSRHIENGGFVKQNNDMVEIERLKTEKLRVDLAQAQRVFKSYPTTQIIAIIACVISVCLLFLKIAEALNTWPYNK